LIYEWRVYKVAPGKMARLHARFRDHTTALFKKHGMTVIGYWTAEVGPGSRLYYLLAYENLAAREAAWASFSADPEWRRVFAESEADGPLVVEIENMLLRPTPYSPLQ
jgi:hypothetical protein